jgi:GT2 family glycosyltransferase
MRVCVFGPDMHAFGRRELRPPVPVPAPGDSAVEEILLTNSRGQPPADGTYVYVTGGTTTLPMRGLRWLLRDPDRARRAYAAATLMTRLIGPDLIEALRAADPDVIVSLDPAWAPHLRDLLRRHRAPWQCLGPGDRWSAAATEWRQYDPRTSVSIVLPTYNGTRYLARSLESCLTQTHRNIELVVVDDGSQASVAEIVGHFGDSRIKYVRHEVNLGLPRALNTGFANTSGALVTWTSDDNYYAPNAIEEMVRFLSTYPQVDFVYADAFEIDAVGKVVGMLRTKPPRWLTVKNRVGACFLYRRVVYETVGEFDSGAVLAEDYDYWLRVARRFTMQRLFKALYYYRFHPESLTGRCERARVSQQAERVKKTNRAWWFRSGRVRRAL